MIGLAVCFTQNSIAQRIILQEDFSANKNKWIIKTSAAGLTDIKDGKFISEGYTDSSQNIAVPVKLDAVKNFSVSVSATHLSGVDNYAYGIYIGNDKGDQFYSFAISAIGFYKFFGHEDGKNRQFIDWTAHPLLNKESGAENNISIIKEGTNIKLNINNQLVATIPNIVLPDNVTIALTRANKQRVAFDNLLVAEMSTL